MNGRIQWIIPHVEAETPILMIFYLRGKQFDQIIYRIFGMKCPFFFLGEVVSGFNVFGVETFHDRDHENLRVPPLCHPPQEIRP